jgi:hypothetical protein
MKNYNEPSERCELCFVEVIRGNSSLMVGAADGLCI